MTMTAISGKALWNNEVERLLNAQAITDEEAEILNGWDNDAINGVQWSGGDIDAIQSEQDAIQAVKETLEFQRKG